MAWTKRGETKGKDSLQIHGFCPCPSQWTGRWWLGGGSTQCSTSGPVAQSASLGEPVGEMRWARHFHPDDGAESASAALISRCSRMLGSTRGLSPLAQLKISIAPSPPEICTILRLNEVTTRLLSRLDLMRHSGWDTPIEIARPLGSKSTHTSHSHPGHASSCPATWKLSVCPRNKGQQSLLSLWVLP